MANLIVHAGICGFTVVVNVRTENMQNMTLEIETECPNIQQASDVLGPYDAYAMMSKKPHETAVYQDLAAVIPHTACPVYCGCLKAIEAAAGLALPADAAIEFADED